MKRILVIVIILCVFSSVPIVTAQTKRNADKATLPKTPKFGNTDGITAGQLRNYLEFLASDELEGRDTPSRGLDIAAMYIANHLKRWGIKPAGDKGTYDQKIPLKRHFIDVQKTKLEVNGQSFIYGEDFLSNFADQNISGNLVYVGHGWLFKSKNIDAYQGLDVKDKIVVIVNRTPKGYTPADTQGKQSLETWASPIFYAQLKGAKAVIQLSSFADLLFWKEELNESVNKGSLVFENPIIHIPVLKASPKLVNEMFKGEKSSGYDVYTRSWSPTKDFAEPFDLKATKKITFNIALRTEYPRAQNVIGILEGSDPILKNEYVAIGAHYDHVGVNPDAPGEDKIWNGADDDGSGTSAVLAMAEAFSKGAQRPKRSILFVWHAGEEKGLWGSQYFTDNPTVPIGSIVTQLNIDMIGRAQQPGDEDPKNKSLAKQGEVFVLGPKLMSSELEQLSETTNNSFLKLAFNYKYDDPNDSERHFYRSDHYNYARKGIPVIFYSDGGHADYHQPSDSVEKIDFEQMEKITRTIFATGWELANRPTRPKVDKPLPLQVN